MSKRFITAASYGTIGSFIVILFCTLGLSSILRFTSATEESISMAPMIISFAALFVGGVIAGTKMQEKGLIIGVVTGVTYCVLVLLIQFLGYNHTGWAGKFLYYGENIIASTIGGIIGVNFFSRSYKK
ncbi:TIGR04086 family membrane protein [Terrilactibacillus sp. BCM23-1]|uniref:TIGR04086 family membrane protein n=1 Tax=Terrilactibacillus tamarindi TaxID=2599694 RepID=A0A6N8CQK5_9BACI|nr:TIGR04086 family membrane protein [Terrilactibacillus tamarindi]MTT32434.1 TIGR04086 family membrane protein [Terrilactibacillus tamarindi]